KVPAVHNLHTTSLPDGKKVRFSLKSLQTPRREKLSPVEPSELVRLTENLIKEMQKYPEEVSSLVRNYTLYSLMKAVEDPFLKGLLLNDSPQNVGIRFKLHRILREAKNREREVFSDGLSPTSTLMLQLLVNVRTCPTGEEDGVDVTYRLISDQRGASEEAMTIERRQEKSRETIMEELRKMRESLLNGEGPVVKHFIKDRKNEEPPHQAKYLRNLLLGQIGTGFEGEKLSFDLGGGAADEDLRKAPLQEVLDVFHSLYTPEKAIENFLEAFNSRRLPGTFMTSVIGEDTLSKNYDLYYDMDEDKWKPHAIVDLLLHLGILEEGH
ncbi:MAG: hypothetical protein JNJ47_07615, partial [Alphaproteobacteria bacterium]|nr:hypothetical protein [Alphaproteobacteria bacterium]